MPAIKSLDELKRIREEALKKKEMKTASGSIQVIVAMGTCGIAAGARDTMKSVLNYIEKRKSAA
jgi:NADP-reducing hydrogenase subunit HndB